MQTKNQGEIEIFAVFRLLFTNKARILLFTLAGGVLGLAFLFVLPPAYKSENIFIVTGNTRENPLEQWNMLAEQFGFRMAKTTDPLLTMLDLVLASEKFYEGMVDLSVNPAYKDSSLVRLLRLESVPPEERLKAFTAKAVRIIKFRDNKDNSFTIRVKTKSAQLSSFLSNRTAEHLNQFFLERAKTDLNRKIAFLTSEMAANRREVDSLSALLRVFLEANRDFSSPLLNFRYKAFQQTLLVANEKYLLTMKAHQSLKISASQPEYFFELVLPAEAASPRGSKTWMTWGLMVLAGSFFLSCAGIILSQWLMRISWDPPEKA